MATLSATIPTRTGNLSPGAAVSASDVIPGALLGSKGAILEILNGNAAQDNITISDFGLSPAGSPQASNNFGQSVANGANKVFLIVQLQGDPNNNGQVTVTHSVTSSVTYKLYPLG